MLKLSGQQGFNSFPIPGATAIMLQLPERPVQEGEQFVRQDLWPIERLHPLPMLNTLGVGWAWRGHEMFFDVLPQSVAKFNTAISDGVFKKAYAGCDHFVAVCSICPCRFLITADCCFTTRLAACVLQVKERRRYSV